MKPLTATQKCTRALAWALAVSFLFAPVASLAREFFTIAVIPDTQNYVDSTQPQPRSLVPFKAETQYLANHKRELNLAFVTHVGDVVQHGDGTNGTQGDKTYGGGDEWVRATEAMDILAAAQVPFGMAIGNHDYDNYSWTTGSRPLKSTVMWRTYFGSASPLFAGRQWYGGASDALAVNPGLSSYQVFSAAGRRFLHISLELEAGDAALAWVQSVIDSHRGYPTIVTTHAYISPPAEADGSAPLEVPASRIAATYLTDSPGGWNDAQAVWDKLIARNDQIFMVVCGHAWNPSVNGVSKGENLRIGMNTSGHPVYQVLSDYQGNITQSTGGDGWLRLMEFDVDAGLIHFSTYSPALQQHAGRDGETTFHQAPTFSDFTLPMPIQVTNAGHEHRHGRHLK